MSHGRRGSFDNMRGSLSVNQHDDAVADMLGSLHVQLSNHHRGLLASARTFLPEIVIDAVDSGHLEDDKVIVNMCNGAVVFSDASGFTALTERLAQYSNGAEKLSKCLNKFFTPLIDMLTAYRGDVIKFSGDALTILFAACNDNRDFVHACGSPSCSHAPLELACLRASACCIEIHKRLHNFDTGEGGVRLTLHIGVGAGPVTILQVGGHEGRYEYVIAGQPLEQIAIAEPLAGSGETVLSPQCWVHVRNTVVEGPPIEGNLQYHRLQALDISKHTYPTIKQAAQQSCIPREEDEELGDDELERRLRLSMRFVPRSVLKQLRTGSLRGINEMRTVSIIFVQIGGVDVSTELGSRTAKQLMHGMQSIAYSEEGSLNKFLVDDKGLLFLFVFGLPPLVHVDDPTRACRACLHMTQLLMNMNLTGRIGITTGRVYCGLVGSDTRKEYTVMGDTVNLSARLMANAQANSVLVDETTFKRCQNEFTFLKLTPIKVKGKEQKISIYMPQPIAPVAAAVTMPGAHVEETLHKPAGRQHVLQAKTAAGQKVRTKLPWPPKSTIFGGKSRLPEVKSWKQLSEATECVTTRLAAGGACLMIQGESGCGKEEIAEALLKRQVEKEGMVPLFGTMQMRSTEEWKAPRELICTLLQLLHMHGTDLDVDSFQASDVEVLAKKEGLTESELDLLKSIMPSSKSNARQWMAHAASSRSDLRTAYGGSAEKFNKSMSLKPSNTLSKFGSFSNARGSRENFGNDDETFVHDQKEICNIALRLLEKLLLRDRVIVVLRQQRGTSLSLCDTSLFWLLVKQLTKLAHKQKPDRMMLVVLCRSDMSQGEAREGPVGDKRKHSFVSSASSLSDSVGRTDVIDMKPLSDNEAQAFVGLVLKVEKSAIPENLLEWLSSITLNSPRNIAEVLAQLREEEKITITNGRVVVAADLNSIDIAAWVHTGMVGSIISQIEMMGAEAQRIIKMATVFDGPFSALDVAAANRVHRPVSDILAFHDSVHLLMSCEWLVSQNFLRRYEYDREAQTMDGQTWRLPRWAIPNLLIRKVVGATLLQSQKMQIKRAVLVQRALNIHLPDRMRKKMEVREELFGKTSKAEKIRQQRRRELSTNQWDLQSQMLQSGKEKTFTGLPSSCIVLPIVAAHEMGIHQQDQICIDLTNADADEPFPVLTHNKSKQGRIGAKVSAKPAKEPGQLDPEKLRDWLSLMSSSGHMDKVNQLLKKGAPVSLRDCASLTPLHFACLSGDLALVKALVQAKADYNAAADEYGTPVEVAAEFGHLSVVQFFVEELKMLAPMSQGPTELGVRMTNALDSAEVSPPPIPSLHHDMNSVIRVDESNYRRSQTLNFIQNCICLVEEEEAADKVDPMQGNGSRQTKVQIEQKASTFECLRDLDNSRMKGYVIFLFVVVAVLGPDVWVLADWQQSDLDHWLAIALVVFVGDMALRLAVNPEYRYDYSALLLDFVGTLALIFQISWIFGDDWEEDWMETDKILDGRSGSFKMVFARTGRGGDLLVRASRWSGTFARMVNTIFICCLGRHSQGDRDFGGVEKFRKQLLHVIGMNVAIYTTVLLVVCPLTDFMLLPREDRSMKAWSEVLTGVMPHGEVGTPEAAVELSAFTTFYDKLAYGPFQVCSGAANPDGSFECGSNSTIWQSFGGEARFAEPDYPISRLDMHSNVLELSFDFTLAREKEARMNIAIMALAFSLMVLTTLFISRAVSDLVLRPLQRMLSSARQVAAPLFGANSDFGLGSLEDEIEEEHMDDEVYILEKIVAKLGKIAGIASTIKDLSDNLAGLEGENLGVMQMMHGTKEEEKAPQKENKESVMSVDDKLHHHEVDPKPGKEMQARLELLSVTWEELNSWEFNCLKFEQNQLTGIIGWILLQNTTTYGEVQLAPDVTAKFLQTLAQNYRKENAFHNWNHAVDVVHTMWRSILISSAHYFLTGLNQFALLVSAIGHDVGHFGLNNPFLIETAHELTVRYNDKSPLENMHCAKLFEILSGTPGVNIFEPLQKSEFIEIRKICVDTILHTDMVHHFEVVKDTQMLYQMNSDATEDELLRIFRDRDTKSKLMNLLVHSADVSNPAKPWHITHEWAMRCLAEFFDQGDKEKEMGIPVQMLNDRLKVNKPFSQIGFVEFMIAPLEAAKTQLFPVLYETTEHLEHNIVQWKRLWIEETHPSEEEREKLAGRVSRVVSMLESARDPPAPMAVLGRHNSEVEIDDESDETPEMDAGVPLRTSGNT